MTAAVNRAETARVPRVLSIAGTDPTGGAGLHADLKSIAANGGYGMGAVTSLVAQNTQGVRSIHTPPVSFLAEQLDAVSDDVEIDAVKIGMLGSAEVIEAVSAWLARVRPPAIVLDPVMVATSGDRLLDTAAEAGLRGLLPHVNVVTPNIPELAILVGEPQAATWTEVLEQARRLSRRSDVLVLAKGGHLAGESLPDALIDARWTNTSNPGSQPSRVAEFPGRRIATTNTHGTGCSLSAALATRCAALKAAEDCAQAEGSDVVVGFKRWAEAARQSKAWLTESIVHGAELQVGQGHGPVSHFAGLWKRGVLDPVPDPDALCLRGDPRALVEESRLAPTAEESSFQASPWPADEAR